MSMNLRTEIYDPQPSVFVFHGNCGSNIRLTNGNRTAEKINQHVSSDGMVVSRDTMVPNVLYELDGQPPVLVFHDNCGKNICLTNGNRTAEKIDEHTFCNGVVVSRDAMVPNVLHEVRVDAASVNHSKLSLGVTRISPARLLVTELSEALNDSVIISSSGLYYQGGREITSLEEDLERLEVGSRVGVLVDSSNDLHLFVNGQDKGVVVKQFPPPCFVVFNIWSSVTKVTALPTSRIIKKKYRRRRRLRQ